LAFGDPSSEFYPTRDHKIPKSRGGANHKTNIVLACASCNNEKGDMPPQEFAVYREVTAGIPHRISRLLTWRRHLREMEARLSGETKTESKSPPASGEALA
jgi:5-methylcytosine-specific restriction endonuclease McrA